MSIDFKLCERVKEYARWIEGGSNGHAPSVSDMPARYRLLVDNITFHTARAFSRCTAEKLAEYMQGGPKPPHIPLTADSDYEAEIELQRRAGKASGGEGRSGGGMRMRMR